MRYSFNQESVSFGEFATEKKPIKRKAYCLSDSCCGAFRKKVVIKNNKEYTVQTFNRVPRRLKENITTENCPDCGSSILWDKPRRIIFSNKKE